MARDFSAELFGAPKKEEQPLGRDFSADLFGAAPVAAPSTKSTTEPEAAPTAVSPEGFFTTAPSTTKLQSEVPEDEGFFARNYRYAKDALLSGFEGFRTNIKGEAFAISRGAMLRDEEQYGGPGVPLAPPDVKARYEKNKQEAMQYGRDIAELKTKTREREERSPLRPETARLKAAMGDDVAFLESAKEAGAALISNPPGVIADLTAESFPAMAYMVSTALVGRLGLQSPTAGAVAGGVGSAVSQFGNEYVDRLQKGESHEEAWKNAEIRSGVIGIFDAVSLKTAGSAAGKIVNALKTNKPVTVAAKEFTKELGIQAGLGGAGEAAGSLAIGEVPNPAAVIAEMAGELGTGPFEAVGAYKKVARTAEEQRIADLIKELDLAADKEKGVTTDEQGELAAGAAKPDVTGRVEPSFQAPGAPTDMGGAAAKPGAAGPGGMAIPGVPPSGAGAGAQAAPSPLSSQFTLRADSTPQEKSSVKHYAALQNQPDNPVTQSLAALDTSIQKAKDAYAQIAETLGIPSGQDMMGLGVRLPAPLGTLLNYPSASGSAVRLVNASKDLTSGAKRGSQDRVDSALRDVNWEVNRVDQVIADALAAAEDPAVQTKINVLAEQNAVNKGVAARQAEIASVPMEQRADKIKQIEDEIRAGLRAKKASAAPTPPSAVPTAQELEDTGAIFEDQLERANEFFTGDNDVYGVDTEGNTTKLANPEELAAFHEANKDKAEPDFTAGDAGYYVVPRERAAPATVPDAPTIKENPDAEETRGYKGARDTFLDGQSDIYHIDPDENVTPVTSLKQLQQLNAEWQGDPDAGFWSVPKEAAPKEGVGRILRMVTEAVGPSYDATMATLLKSRKAAFNRLRKLFSEGKINAEQFTEAAIKILDDIDDQKMRDYNKSQRLTRGPDIVRQRILEAVRREKISRETAEFALWLIDKNPQIANELAIKINLPRDKRAQAVSDGTAGYYVSASKLVRAILHRDPETGQYYDTKPEVLVHEILHHAERMLPAPLRKLIRKEWEKQLLRAAKRADKTGDTNLKEFMALLLHAYTTGEEAAERIATGYIVDGRVPYEYYPLINPSEFWAVNGSDILYGRYQTSTNFDKVKQWFSELIEAIKNIFGFNNNHAVIKGLRDVLNGDGTFVSRFLLSEGTAKAPMVTPAKEAQAMEQMLQAGKMSPAVLTALANNDLNGALRLIADRTKGFYGDLARVLSELNLPTLVVLNNPSVLIRRQIDRVVGPQQFRLFDYVQRTYPDVYAKYFKNYDREENLEKVHEGLRFLKDKNYNMGPVVAEFEDVTGAFNKNIKGLVLPGFYAPEFDAISLDTANATNDVLLHEVLHAATAAVIDADPATLTEGQRAALRQLTEMFEYAKAQIPLNLYGFTDLHEFVSELFTNKSFRERLQKIQYQPTRQSLLTSIARTIYRLFGINNLAGNAMAQATQLFSAVRAKRPIPIGLRFANAPRRGRARGPVTNNWRAQEDYGDTLVKLIKKMMVSGKPWPTISKDVGKALFRAKYSGLRRIVLPNLGLRHLADLTKFGFPQLSGAVRIVEQMLAYRQRSMTKAADIVKDWMKLKQISAPMERLMSRIMVEATIRRIDPDTATATDLPPSDPLAKAWNMLPNEFKEVYRRARNYYSDALKETINEMKARIMQSGKPLSEKKALLRELKRQFGPDKLVKPYFPLRRFGQYWFQVGKGNFKEFVEFENESTRNLAMEVRRDELIKIGRKDLADTIRSGNGISELYTKNAASTKVLSDVQEIIDNISTTATIDEAKKDLKNSVDQLIYLLLPQQSMRKMFINRQAVQGASADMLRVFAMTSFHTAYQQSRFKFADAFLNNISNAQQYVDEKYAGSPNGAAYRDFILEVEKRNPQIMSNEDHSLGAVLSSKTSEVTFFYMLTSPATALVNILGFPQLVMSTLGGDYGYAKAYGIALNNLRRYGQSAGKRTVVPLATGNFLQVQFPSIFESGLLPPLEQKAADRFVSENDVNISLTSDIMGLSDSPSELYTGMYDKTKRFVSEPLHQSERMMREIGLLTAFQLAYEKLSKEPKRDLSGYILRDKNNQPIMRTQDEIFEDAIQEARDKIGLTLGDFNRQMKPRTMAIPGLNVLFIFKTFAIFASVYIARNTVAMFRPISKSEREDIRQLLIKDLKNAPNAQQIIDQRLGEIDAYLNTQRKEAFRRMAGVFGVATLLGGVEANPFFSMLGSILAMFLGPDDDEDEYFDWENWFRNYCEVELGGYASDLLKDMGASEETAKKYGENIGMSVARGPVGVMTGASLSDRVSLDLKNMWIRDPRYSRDARQEVYETAVATAGPAAGLAMNFVDAYQFFQEGKIDRAMEKALPTFMSKPLVASRLAREGATTSSGRQLIDEFSAWEIALQAIGIQPERLAVKQKSVIEAETYKQKILDRKTAIMNRLWFEYENGSDADYEEAQKMKDKFNDMYPEVRITPKELKESFERRRDARRDAESFGANVPKKLRGRIEPMLEYGKTESEK